MIKHALAILFLASCTATQSDSSSGVSAAWLASELRAAGLTVRDAGTVEQPFFSVPARVHVVGGDDVQVYEFRSAAEAERAAATVSPDGFGIGTTQVSWMAPPHFFRKENLVVNYLGSAEPTLRELRRLLGPQFAGR